MTITNKPISQQGSTVAQQGASMADTAADSATSAIRSTQNVANEAFDPSFSDLAVVVHGISGFLRAEKSMPVSGGNPYRHVDRSS